jgi:hypothetical protein
LFNLANTVVKASDNDSGPPWVCVVEEIDLNVIGRSNNKIPENLSIVPLIEWDNCLTVLHELEETFSLNIEVIFVFSAPPTVRATVGDNGH